jgi:hypothetical protein
MFFFRDTNTGIQHAAEVLCIPIYILGTIINILGTLFIWQWYTLYSVYLYPTVLFYLEYRAIINNVIFSRTKGSFLTIRVFSPKKISRGNFFGDKLIFLFRDVTFVP